MTLPIAVIRAIALAVEREGGDIDHVDDLVDVWGRLAAERCGRVERIRYEAAHRPCACVDDGVDEGHGGCGRCYGLLRGGVAR